MIGYITLGSNEFEKSTAFYDELLAVFGATRLMETDTYVAWGVAVDQPMFSVVKPFNKEPASIGNGTMIALAANSTEQVDAFYAKARELGATCEGQPGPREESFYAGYVRDLDGNKINAFCVTQPA